MYSNASDSDHIISGSSMDVTTQILNDHRLYGSSDNTDPAGLVGSKSLNYAKGATLQRPALENVSVVPRRIKYQDKVGLFGVENVYIRVDLNIKDTGNLCFEEPGWQCLKMTMGAFPVVNTYLTAVIDPDKDLITENTYEPAQIVNSLAKINSPMVGVMLDNKKTGNKYDDVWFDVQLYNKAREMHPYTEMYLPPTDYFYIGFHARNQRRLPYNVELIVGTGYKSQNEVDPRLVARVY